MSAAARAGQAQRSGAARPGARTTERFAVASLDCNACGGNLRMAMRVLPGVLAVAPNVSAQEVAITYDPLRLTPGAIRARLDAIGLGHR